MDTPQQQKQSQLLSLLQFAFAQRKFKKVIELADNYLKQFPQSKHIYLTKAKAHSQLNKPEQCLIALDNAIRVGASIKQVSIMKTRSYVQLGKLKEAQKQLNKLMQEDQEIKAAIELAKAIEFLKDDFQVHKLTPKEDNILNEMKSWLGTAGATYPKLMVTNVHPGYRGVIATKNIKKGQPIVYIPKSQLITLEMAKSNPITQLIIEKKIRLHSPKHSFLSLLLLQLRNAQNCKYKPYIDLLPTDHSCFPINYSQNQLKMLQGSPFLKMIFQKVVDLKNDYNTIVLCDPRLQKFSFKDFCWARMMIGSRIFGLMVHGVKTEVLVPFADMLNHRQPKQTIWNYEQSMNGFVIQSLQDIQVGQQVFDSYGKKCNSRFLLNYGFILQDNPDNQINIRLIVDNKIPFAAQKKKMIQENPNENYFQIRKINLNMNNNKFYEFMGVLRFICLQQQETINMLKKISNVEVSNEPYQMIRTPPISVKNEVKVWEKVQSLCQDQIKQYPNTIQEDQNLLKKPNLSQNQSNIIKIRMGEKKTLHQYIKISTQVLSILNSNDLIKALEQKIYAIYARYLYKILSLTPGVNKKAIQKKISPYFTNSNEVKDQQQVQQIPQS